MHAYAHTIKNLPKWAQAYIVELEAELACLSNGGPREACRLVPGEVLVARQTEGFLDQFAVQSGIAKPQREHLHKQFCLRGHLMAGKNLRIIHRPSRNGASKWEEHYCRECIRLRKREARKAGRPWAVTPYIKKRERAS